MDDLWAYFTVVKYYMPFLNQDTLILMHIMMYACCNDLRQKILITVLIKIVIQIFISRIEDAGRSVDCQ